MERKRVRRKREMKKKSEKENKGRLIFTAFKLVFTDTDQIPQNKCLNYIYVVCFCTHGCGYSICLRFKSRSLLKKNIVVQIKVCLKQGYSLDLGTSTKVRMCS